MYQNCCKKCGSTSLHTEIKGNNTGLYCDDCGAFQKWLGKDELRAFNYAKEKKISETVDKNLKNIYKQTELICKEDGYVDRRIIQLKNFIHFLNKKIDSEYEKLPISPEDAIRKNAYCLALQQNIWALENILDGKEWDYKGVRKMEFENDIVITHEETKNVKKPHVVLIENDDKEEFFINGESVCCHKRLYPSDVLDALQEYGIINFEYREEK